MKKKNYIDPDYCPDWEKHTMQPTDFLDWHAWAAEKSETHVQIKCRGCGRYAIWVKSTLPAEVRKADEDLDTATPAPLDPLFDQAKEIVQREKKVSASFLQRKLRIGYFYSAKLLDQLEAAGIIGPKEGAKPRKIL